MHLIYDCTFLHVCILQENLLFSTFILGSVSATMSSFTVIKNCWNSLTRCRIPRRKCWIRTEVVCGMAMHANLLSDEILHFAAVRAADDELGARSHVFHVVAAHDLLTAEVAVDRTIGTVVRQVLVEKAAVEHGPTAVAARRRIELALFCVTLTCRQTALNRQWHNENENDSSNDN